MSLVAYQYQAINYTTLVPLPGASVSIYFTGTSVFAPLYDINGNPISNPMTADVNGVAIFQVQSTAIYDLIAQSGAYVSPRWLLSEIAAYAEFATVLTGLQIQVAAIEAGALTGYQSANEVLASPASGAPGPMSTRALVTADMPPGFSAGKTLLGFWNASTNSPALASGVGTNGTFYIVSVSGSTNLDGNSTWNAGTDSAVFAAGVWNREQNTATVLSVAGRTGNVALTVADITNALAGAEVASLSALAALNTSVSTYAILTQSGLSNRQFNWSSANLSTQVTADPQQGVYVAPASDPTGASGAWVLQFSGRLEFSFFGGNPANTAAQNAAALAGMGKFSAYLATLGGSVLNGVQWYIAPGFYNFDHSLCQGFLYNIPNLDISGYGATFQNTYSGGANFNFQRPWGLASLPLIDNNSTTDQQNWLIQSTTVGATSITFITPAQAGNLTVGQPFMVASLDLQFGGYPPNLWMRDFVIPTAINTSTGVVTLDRKLRNAHLSTFPDIVSSLGASAARAWLLTTNQSGLIVNWNIKHVYRGLTVLPCTLGGSQQDQEITGRFMQIIDWTGVGCSESIAENVDWDNPHFLYSCEPDKLVWRQRYKNLYIDTVGMNFQSSSPEFLEIDGGKVSGGMFIGCKFVSIKNLDVDSLTIAGEYGPNISATVENSRVLAYPSWKYGTGIAGSLIGVIDGTNVTFANGAFTILKAFVSSATTWNLVLHQQLYLMGPNGFFVGDPGLGIVTGFSVDGSGNYVIQTTLPYATLPSWATGNVSIIKAGTLRVINSTGCDQIEQSSWATAHGLQEWEVFRQVFSADNQLIASSFWPGGWVVGQATSISINVRQASNVGGTQTMTLHMFNMIQAAPPFTTQGTWSIVINLAVAGNRIITPSGIVGAQSGDSFQINGGAFTTLPALLFGGSYNYTTSFTWASFATDLLPVVEYFHQSTLGLFRQSAL